MRKLIRYICLLLAIGLLCGCAAQPALPEINWGKAEVPSFPPNGLEEDTPAQSQQPESQPEPVEPAEDPDLLPGYTKTQRPKFPLIQFETFGPYTPQEQEALTGNTPWQGLTTWDTKLERRVYNNELCRIENGSHITRMGTCPLDGTLVAACPAPEEQLCLLTNNGDVWFTDLDGCNGQQVGTLKGLEGLEIDNLWANMYTDGEVVWFGYGRQIARLYLPTGRVDSGFLSEPCRLWQPMTRSALYCQYLLKEKEWVTLDSQGCPAYEIEMGTGHLPVRQAGYDLEQNIEQPLTPSQTLQLQSRGYLFRQSETDDPYASSLPHAEYFSVERPVRKATASYIWFGGVSGKPTGPFWFTSCHYYAGDLLDKNLYMTHFSISGSLSQMWSSNYFAIQVDCPLNGHILQTHYSGGVVYLWTDDNKMYCTDVDGQKLQLLGDFGSLVSAAQLADVQFECRFEGPTGWVKAGEQLYRVYLPGGEVETFDFAFPADTTWWWILSNHAIEYKLADGSWMIYNLASGEGSRVDDGEGRLPGAYGDDFNSYLPYYEIPGFDTGV